MLELMIETSSWLAMAFVLLQFWFLSKGQEKPAFFSALVACVFWAVFAIPTSAWALLTLEVAIAFLCARGLLRLRQARKES